MQWINIPEEGRLPRTTLIPRLCTVAVTGTNTSSISSIVLNTLYNTIAVFDEDNPVGIPESALKATTKFETVMARLDARILVASSSYTIKDLQNMCYPQKKLYFCILVELYDINLHPDEVMITSVMLWYSFLVLITGDMTRILHHYDVCSIQLSSLIVLAYERDKFLEKKFTVKFGYEEIVFLIDFNE